MPPSAAPSPHAAGTSGLTPADLPWVLELARSTGRASERAARVAQGTTAGLGLLAALVWLYDLFLLVPG